MRHLFLAAALLVTILPGVADARQRHAARLAPSQHYAGPGAAVFAATSRAQNEPGLTEELSPGTPQTATGGPSGGIPDFSGF